MAESDGELVAHLAKLHLTELFFPEERRHEFTTEPWDGVSFRHYRNPKIVCLEHYRPPDKRIPTDRIRAN